VILVYRWSVPEVARALLIDESTVRNWYDKFDTSTEINIGGQGGQAGSGYNNKYAGVGGTGGEGRITVSGGTLTFLDAVHLGGDGGKNDLPATVKGNGGNGYLTVTGGSVNLLNSVTLGGSGNQYGIGKVEISGGRVFLGGNADIRLNGIAAFTMTGGTFATTVNGSRGHSISATNIKIDQKATLEFDLSGANASTLNLLLNGAVGSQIGGGSIRITGVDAAPSEAFLYNLVDTRTSGKATDTEFGWSGNTLTKTGSGTLYLDAANTYTGGTSIEQGTIVATDRDALGTGDVQIGEYGTLVLDWNDSGVFANGLEGNGWFIIRSGNVEIDRSNAGFTADGTTYVDAQARLDLHAENAVGDSVLIVYGTVGIWDDFGNNFCGNGHIVFGHNGLVIDYANDGFGGFNGTVELAESMTLGHVRGFGDARQVEIGDYSILSLDFNGRFNTPMVGSEHAGVFVDDGSLVGIDTDNSAYEGKFTIGRAAIVTITNINALGNSQNDTNPVTNDGGILHFNFDDSGEFVKDIEGAGGVYKSGSSTLTLSGDLTYTGDTVVNGGSLIADLYWNLDPWDNDTHLSLAHDGTTFQIRSRNLELYILDGVGKVVFDGNGKSLSVGCSDFSDGEIRNVDKLTVGGFSILSGEYLTVGNVQAKNLEVLDNAKLTLTPNHFITLENGASFGENSVFGVSINDNDQPLVMIGNTAQWYVHPTATLDIQGYHNQPTVLFETSGDEFDSSLDHWFRHITVAGNEITGTLTKDQFIDDINVTINPDNRAQIIATSGFLVWYNGVTPGTENYDAHGTFKVDTYFFLDEQLNDNESDRGKFFDWDGKTLTKTGDGTLSLGTVNTYTGGTWIENGHIVMTNSDAIGTGDVIIKAGAALDLTYTGVFVNKFSGNGTLSFLNDMSIMSNNPDFAGRIQIYDGETTATQILSLGNNIATTLGENALLLYNVNENGTVANSIGGKGSFAKGGTGDLTVTGTQTYTGETSVWDGRLIMNLPTGTDLFINRNAVFENIDATDIMVSQLNGMGELNAKNANFAIWGGNFGNGKLDNVGNFTKETAETLTMNGNLNIGGDFTLADGTLILTGTPAITVAGTATFDRGTTLSFSVADLTDGATVISANNAYIDRNTTLDITGYNGETELTLLETTGGWIIGDFSEYYLNGVAVSSSVVTFETFFVPGGIEKTLEAITLKQAHLVWNNTEPLSAHGTFLIETGIVTINRDLADNPHEDAWMYNPIYSEWWDGKSLTKTGEATLVLNGENTFSGDVHVRAGTLIGTHVNSFGDPNSDGRFILDAGTTLIFDDFDVTVTKTVEGFGRLLTAGDSTFTFAGDASKAYGIFQQEGGTVNLHSDWGGYYLMTSGLFKTDDDRFIAEGATFAGGVVDHAGTLTIGRNLWLDHAAVCL